MKKECIDKLITPQLFRTAQKEHNSFNHWNNKKYSEESWKRFTEERGGQMYQYGRF